VPRKATKNATSAKLGTARPMFETLVARNWPRPVWPSTSPIGMATAQAMPIAAKVSSRWSPISPRTWSPPTGSAPRSGTRSSIR
jgi:hypothetical protein